MAYLKRSIEVINEKGETTVYEDDEFFSLSAPLVILGEPGAGKSEVVQHYATQNNQRITIASTVDTIEIFPDPVKGKKLIVDGIDEVTAYGEEGAPISRILRKISASNTNFVLTCRGADWQNAINETLITDKWQIKPIVGRLLPLSAAEIAQFVNQTSNKIDGNSFVGEARKRDVLELARNPQMLILLLKNVETDGWPSSKFELFERACNALVKEENRRHRSLNKKRPSVEVLLDAAGFIFSQLLLSGSGGISNDGEEIQGLIRTSDLTSEAYPEDVIKNALGTKLFKVAGQEIIQPCHRTVAEYLGAKWLSAATRRKLSFRRLEKILYSDNFIVPTSLRGIHAWLANHSNEQRKLLISRDPYGFLRYGDADVLSTLEVRNLFEGLEKLAEFDPYFRAEDWHASFSNGLARMELKDDFIKLIRKVPYQLGHLMLEVIRGSELSKSLKPELLEIVLDARASVSERFSAGDGLNEIGSSKELVSVVPKLLQAKKIDDLRVALHLIEGKTSIYKGEVIGEAILSIGDPEIRHNFAGLGYKLETKISNAQRIKVLDKLTSSISKAREELNSPSENRIARRRSAAVRKFKDVESWILRLIKAHLESDEKISAKQLWSWLKNVDRGGFFKSDWDKFNVEFFKKHVQLKQEIQSLAFSDAKFESDVWLQLFDFRDMAHGLMLSKDDLILHLQRFAKERLSNEWPKRWQNLARWAKSMENPDAYAYAKEQASNDSELAKMIEELELPPKRDYEAEDRARTQRWERKQDAEKRKRHKSYLAIRDKLKTGNHFGALNEIGRTILGYYSDFPENNHRDRLKSLVGEELVSDALDGLFAAVNRDDVPSVREMTEIRVQRNQFYNLESVIVAYASIKLTSEGELKDFSPEFAASALAARELGIFGREDAGDLIDPQDALEKIVFSTEASLEKFLKDFFEPSLEAGLETVRNLHNIQNYGSNSKVIGRIAIEWLTRFSSLNKTTLKELLQVAISYGDRQQLLDLVKIKIAENNWIDKNQQALWLGVAFLLDLKNYEETISEFVASDQNNINLLREFIFLERNKDTFWPSLNAEQNYFLLSRVLSTVSESVKVDEEDNDDVGFSGSSHFWGLNQFIYSRIEALAADFTSEATKFLKALADDPKIVKRKDHVKHALAQQLRGIAESTRKSVTLSGVRQVLLGSQPANSEDLQALLLDELELLQRRISHSPYDSMLPYWSGDTPQNENYCRSRIVEQLEQSLSKYNVRCFIEGAMPQGNRCDFLNTHGEMNLPVEVKGQWHDDVWKAANDQLQDYTREYRADGRGIYLVLWFGSVPNKNPPRVRGSMHPKSAEEMKNRLREMNPALPSKTQLVVLDVSKPVISDRKKKRQQTSARAKKVIKNNKIGKSR